MKWTRITAHDKLAFREDLQSDPTLTDLQKRMISVVAQHWDNPRMRAECSLSFIAAGAGTTKKMAHRYAPRLTASGRVSFQRPATYTESTMWQVNWWFRGSAWVRQNNGGQPVSDCRRDSPSTAQGESPNDAYESPSRLRGGVPQAGDQFPPTGGYIGAPSGACPDGGTQAAPLEEREAPGHPTRPHPGYAKWRIVHAEYAGDEEDILVAHLRSGKSRKFVLRCHTDSDDYWSIDEALGIDDPEDLIGGLVCMSTNRTGGKTFMRAAPLPWTSGLVLGGDDTTGGAVIRFRFDDESDDADLHLTAADVGRLAAAAGGKDEAVGVRIQYRVMPDDSFTFRLAPPARTD